MLTQPHREAWAEVQEELRRRLGEERFARWIAPLKVLSADGDEVRLGVPNRHVLDWIEKRYKTHIIAALREQHGSNVSVSLAIDSELFRERRQEKESVLADVARPAREEKADAGGSGSESGAPTSESAVHAAAMSETPDMSLGSFVVGRSNELAFNAALQVLDHPGALYNPFFVHGVPGVGKTHLLKGLHRALRQRRRQRAAGFGTTAGAARPGAPGGYLKVRYLSGEQFFNQFAASIQDGSMRTFRDRYRSLDVLILDDVHLLVNKKKTQVEFLHTFNSLAEAGHQIILASDAPPKELGDLDPGLVGRFLSGLVVRIKKPDYETRVGIARLHARHLGCRFEAGVLEFLAESIRGSARELIGAIKQLDIHAQVNGGALGLEAAREALAEVIREEARRISLEKILQVVAAHFRLGPETILSRSRQCHVVLARQVAIFLARSHTEKSLAEIGKFFGGRNHTTVRSALARVEALLADPAHRLRWDLGQIRDALSG